MRALDDVITTDNPGVVPEAYLTELIGVIDASRPFLADDPPARDARASGMTLNVPVINQRPTAERPGDREGRGRRARRRSSAREAFDAVTIAGAGDLSIQIIKRSSPSVPQPVDRAAGRGVRHRGRGRRRQALFNATGGVGAGNPLNPASLNLGAAYMASFDAIRRPPDTIWLSDRGRGRVHRRQGDDHQPAALSGPQRPRPPRPAASPA